MQDFIIQVVSTLVSAFIIYLIGYIKNFLNKLIANKIFKYIFFCLLIYIVQIINIVVMLKLIINTRFNIAMYIIGIPALAFGFYTTIYIANVLKLLFDSFTINNVNNKNKN